MVEKLLATVKLADLLCEDKDKRQSIAQLVAYIKNNRDVQYGSISLRGRVEAKSVLVCNTEPMEKNIETVIGRRFRKHVMRWTTKGAGCVPNRGSLFVRQRKRQGEALSSGHRGRLRGA